MLEALQTLDYVVLICQDTPSMKDFYHNQLGLPIHRDFGDWVEFRIGTTLLTLRTRHTGYDQVRDHDGEAAPSGSASLQLAFRVALAQVDSCFVELQQKQVTIIQPPTNHEGYGHRTLFFTDPENNILEIYADL